MDGTGGGTPGGTKGEVEAEESSSRGRTVEVIRARHHAEPAAATILVSGKGKDIWIHLISEEDDMESQKLKLKCGRFLNRLTANQETAHHFKLYDRKPCPGCKEFWPEGLAAIIEDK